MIVAQAMGFESFGSTTKPDWPMKIENYKVKTSLYGQKREIKGESFFYNTKHPCLLGRVLDYPFRILSDIGMRIVKHET